MKFLSYILSIYLVILSCLPCADVETSNFTHTASKIGAKHDNHSHDQENDACSPFCICNCCGQTTLNHQEIYVYSFLIHTVEINNFNSKYHSSLIPVFSGSIWQPPQLV